MLPADRPAEPLSAAASLMPGETAGDRRTLGFLFADLRGYTAFVEANGDAAAAELLGRYRAMVRETVARFGGAEIKTEGDSFYVVFQSASVAVECGLAVVEGAAAESEQQVSRPIRVGIGVHAGETVEADGGYVGSAVNIAARVCSVARAGEVTVSETVYGLIRTALPVHFLPRGTPRLKGISQPIAIYAVKRGAAPSLAGWQRAAKHPRSRRLGLIAGGLVVVLAAGFGAVRFFPGLAVLPSASPPGAIATVEASSPDFTAAPSPTAPRASEKVAVEFAVGPLEPGTYISRVTVPSVALTVGPGWTLVDQLPHALWLSYGSKPGLGLFVVRYEDAILPDEGGGHTLARVLADSGQVVQWLSKHPYLRADAPVEWNYGQRGLSIDFAASIPGEASQGCSNVIPCVALFALIREQGSSYFDRFAATDGSKYRVAVVDNVDDVAGSTRLFILEASGAEDADEFFAAGQSVLTSVRFSPGQ